MCFVFVSMKVEAKTKPQRIWPVSFWENEKQRSMTGSMFRVPGVRVLHWAVGGPFPTQTAWGEVV